MLIDDNPEDRMLYRRYLGQGMASMRVEIAEASSGEDGLALFKEWQPDCVLLDYNLPDTDGLTMLEGLQALAPPDTLCVVMITGGGSETLAVRALNSGALDYLVKQEFDRELLTKTVAHAIEKNEWRQYVARYHSELQGVNRQLRDSLAELTTIREELHDKNAQLSSANEAIIARNQQLARTNQDLDNFVYAASHDLRQPVNNLNGLFDELRRSATFHDPEEAVVLRLIDDSLQSLSTTITDLAAVVQEQRSHGEQFTESISFADVATDVLQVLQPQLIATQGEVETDFNALPMLTYVRSNLRTILLNLLSNALKYHEPNRAPYIRVRSYETDGLPVLEVADNGLGMNLNRYGNELFHLFRRFHPQVGEGTGVGLFLVNRLVQGHGGSVAVESQEHQGTTFRIFLHGKNGPG
nr:hybrid sensor histidine kinase/response regulator [Hymenobacter negativus]